MPAGEPTRASGRFARSASDEDLYRQIRRAIDASRLAPNEPVSVRTFDRIRVLVADEKIPSARWIMSRLQRSSPQIVAIARQEDGTPTVRGAAFATSRAEEDHHLDGRSVLFARKAVADRTERTTLTEAQYIAGRNVVVEQARRQNTIGFWQQALPTVGQIIRVAGTWDLALAIAGLDMRPGVKLTEEGREKVP